jgi:tetratricopeptide (TPR) repeat protein
MELNPTFTRALYNLGVSCLNIGVYQEAAEHLLSALSLHHQNDDNYANSLLTKAEQVNQSQSLWSTLRRALFSMVRRRFLSHTHTHPLSTGSPDADSKTSYRTVRILLRRPSSGQISASLPRSLSSDDISAAAVD